MSNGCAYDDETGVPICPKCGCPSFTSMQRMSDLRWAGQCNGCGYAFWLDGDRGEIVAGTTDTRAAG